MNIPSPLRRQGLQSAKPNLPQHTMHDSKPQAWYTNRGGKVLIIHQSLQRILQLAVPHGPSLLATLNSNNAIRGWWTRQTGAAERSGEAGTGVRVDVAPDVLAALVERNGDVVACNRWAEEGCDLKG